MYLTFLIKYDQGKRLYSAVARAHEINLEECGLKDKAYVLKESFKVVYSLLQNKYYQKYYGSKRVSKHLSTVSFYHHQHWYLYPLIIENGPKADITEAWDHNGDDVLGVIKSLAGPNVDFFGVKLSPKDIGFRNLTMVVDEKEYIFTTDEEISF